MTLSCGAWLLFLAALQRSHHGGQRGARAVGQSQGGGFRPREDLPVTPAAAVGQRRGGDDLVRPEDNPTVIQKHI